MAIKGVRANPKTEGVSASRTTDQTRTLYKLISGVHSREEVDGSGNRNRVIYRPGVEGSDRILLTHSEYLRMRSRVEPVLEILTNSEDYEEGRDED